MKNAARAATPAKREKPVVVAALSNGGGTGLVMQSVSSRQNVTGNNLPGWDGGAGRDTGGRASGNTGDNAGAAGDARHDRGRSGGGGGDDNGGRGHGGNAGGVGDDRGLRLGGGSRAGWVGRHNRGGRGLLGLLRLLRLLGLDGAGLRNGDVGAAGRHGLLGLLGLLRLLRLLGLLGGLDNGGHRHDDRRGGFLAVVAVGDGHDLGLPGGLVGLAGDGAGGSDDTVTAIAVRDVGAARGDGDGLGLVHGLLGLLGGQGDASDEGNGGSGETHVCWCVFV